MEEAIENPAAMRSLEKQLNALASAGIQTPTICIERPVGSAIVLTALAKRYHFACSGELTDEAAKTWASRREAARQLRSEISKTLQIGKRLQGLQGELGDKYRLSGSSRLIAAYEADCEVQDKLTQFLESIEAAAVDLGSYLQSTMTTDLARPEYQKHFYIYLMVRYCSSVAKSERRRYYEEVAGFIDLFRAGIGDLDLKTGRGHSADRTGPELVKTWYNRFKTGNQALALRIDAQLEHYLALALRIPLLPDRPKKRPRA